MRILRLLLVLLYPALVTAPAGAQSAEERAQLDWAWQRGSLIYKLDRAAWVATDDALARAPGLGDDGARGWVVEQDGNAEIVTFYGGANDDRVAFCRARIEGGHVASSEVFDPEARPPLTPIQQRMVAAREAAREVELRRCVNLAFNTVVIPPTASDGLIDVYLLTPQMRDREWPAGGHHKVTIGTDGRVISSRAFTNACLPLQGGDLGGNVSGLVVTHLLDPLPTEIHVFIMWVSGLPLAVGTNEPSRVWWLDHEGIRLVQEGD